MGYEEGGPVGRPFAHGTLGPLACAMALAVLLVCLGCASGPSGAGRADAVMVGDVPFFTQEAYQCGPTALAAVMDYWYRKKGRANEWITPEEIGRAIYSRSARGVLGIDLETYARRHGFATRQYSGGPGDLRASIDRGIPPIIFVDYGILAYQANHFMVVTGYTADGVLVNTGRREGEWLSDRALEKIWKRNKYWTLVLEPAP